MQALCYSLRRTIIVLGAIVLFGFTSVIDAKASNSLQFSGTVKDEEGKPIEGALITISEQHREDIEDNESRNMDLARVFVSAYTGKDGAFDVVTSKRWKTVHLEIRHYGFKKQEQNIDSEQLTKGDGKIRITLKSGIDPDVVPASSFLARRKIGPDSNAMIMECVSCHQFPHPEAMTVGESLEGMSQEERESFWTELVRTMRERYADVRPVGTDMEFSADADTSFIGHVEERLIASYLAENSSQIFSQDFFESSSQRYPFGSKVARLTEFEIPGPHGMLHDVVALRERGGKRYLWAADFQNNFLVRLDPEGGSIKRYSAPEGQSGPHSLIPDEKGNLWVTFNLSDAIGKLDTSSGKWRVYEGFSKFSLPHSIAIDERFQVRFDIRGRLWTSLIGRNALASLDPESGEVVEYSLPQPEGQAPSVTRAYGVVMSSDQKTVWFTQVGGHAFGALDTQTGKLKFYRKLEYGSGPRRLAIDEKDILWIPLYGAGVLLKFDTETREEIGRYPLPNQSSAPYVASYDPIRKKVWIGTSNADVLYSFDPKTGTFQTWPLPRKRAFIRSNPIDAETGCLTASYAQIPPSIGPDMVLQLDPRDNVNAGGCS